MLAGNYETTGLANNVIVSDNYTYVADGSNVLVILRVNSTGIDIDTIPPTLTITSPLNSLTVTTPAITITGTASDDISVASIIVNDIIATGTTNWSADIALTEGVNTITVVATDAAGNTATETVTVTADIHPSLVFAITPTSRVAQVGVPVTLFMSIINGGTANATNVTIAQTSSLPATISYQIWDGMVAHH